MDPRRPAPMPLDLHRLPPAVLLPGLAALLLPRLVGHALHHRIRVLEMNYLAAAQTVILLAPPHRPY